MELYACIILRPESIEEWLKQEQLEREYFKKLSIREEWRILDDSDQY